MFFKQPKPITPEIWPDVDIVIAAYNEFEHLNTKINSIRKQNYPGNIRIILSSDGSDDETHSWASQKSDITLLISEKRRGKPAAINDAIHQLAAPVTVFTDARQPLNRKAIRALVERLQDPVVGAVSGELIQIDPNTGKTKQMGIYWKYEKFIRRSEARVHSVPGVTGALYAMRTDELRVLHEDCILDDFDMPIDRLRHKQRIVFEPESIVYDHVPVDINLEKSRKIRTLTGNFQSFSRNSWLFSVRKNPIIWQFLSHKVFRLFIPYALITCLVTATLLSSEPVYLSLMVIQIIFYMAAFSPKKYSSRLLSIARIFVQLNWAALIAAFLFATGKTEIKWIKNK